MIASPQHQADPRFTFHASRFTLNSILLALLCFICAACGTTAPTGKILFDDPRGTVSLQTIPHQSIQATHPITIDPILLAQVLRGILVQDQGDHMVQKLLAGSSAPVPAFSDEQIQFLAPLLAEGLRTAAPDQQIEYRVQTVLQGSMFEFSTTETTAGSLYAYGRQLFVTLSQYRYEPNRTNINVRNINYQSVGLDYNGLKNRVLLFTPSVAQRSDSFDPPPVGNPTDRFLAIDYQLLQQVPPRAATTGQAAPQMGASPTPGSPVGTSPSEAQTHSTNTEALAQEVEALRKELQSVQQQLGNQPAKQNSPKRKTVPPFGPQKPAP
jgi:hypothetical protein